MVGGFEFYSDPFVWSIKAIVCVIIMAWNSVVNHPLATSCEILVTSAKFLVTLATRKVQFQTLNWTLEINLHQYASSLFLKGNIHAALSWENTNKDIEVILIFKFHIFTYHYSKHIFVCGSRQSDESIDWNVTEIVLKFKVIHHASTLLPGKKQNLKLLYKWLYKNAEAVTTEIHRVSWCCCHVTDSGQEPMGSWSSLNSRNNKKLKFSHILTFRLFSFIHSFI